MSDLNPARVQTPTPEYPQRLNKRESKVVETASAASQAVNVAVAKATISFADLVHGVDVEFGPEIPEGAIVAKCYGRVTTAFDSDGDGSSTVSLGLNTNSDVQSAESINGAPWSTIGMKEFLDGAAGNMLPLTAARRLKARLAVVATDTELEAGQVDVYLEYVLPPA